MAATRLIEPMTAGTGRGTAIRLPIFPISLLLTLLATAVLIVANSGRPVFDQASLVGIPLDHYPAFDDEVVPRLLAGTLYAVGPRSLAAANTLLRLASAAVYVGAAALLARSLLRTSWARAALLALLLASGYPFLWLSSELLAGAFLCLAIWLVVTYRSPWLIGACLGALSLTKSEMVVASAAIALVYLRYRPDRIRPLLTGFAVLVAALIAPGLAQHGAGFFVNRSWSAFGQHYAAMASEFHLMADRDPWNDWTRYVAASFPGDSSVLQVVLHHKVQYTYYVTLAAITGLWNAWRAFGLLLVAIALRIARRGSPRSVDGWLLVAMVTLIPEVLVAYPHVRYLAKLAPLVVMIPLAEIERRRDGWGIVAAGLLLVYAVLAGVPRFETAGPAGWFPD
jgi:hypothetical protein